MNDASYASWVLVIFFFGIMCMSAFSLGDAVIQAVLRIRSRDKRASFEKWGVSSDLFRPNPPVWFALWSVSTTLSTAFTFFVAFASTVLVSGESASTVDRFYYTANFALYAFFLGSTIEAQRVQKITLKTRKLEALRELFHQRFSVSELLSMYEGLSIAPPLFWEEYANLQDDHVNQETNRSYRERAAPYIHSRTNSHTMIVIAVAVLTLILTAFLAAKELLP